MHRALVALILLPSYGNLFNLAHARLGRRRQEALAWLAPLALLGAVLTWQRDVRRTTYAPLGLTPEGLRNGLAWGAAAGATLAAPAALWFRLPGRPPVQADELSVPLSRFLTRVFFTTPLLVAGAEEIAFRGFLQGRLSAAFPHQPRLAVALSTLSFAAWHVTINVQTLRRTNVVRTGLTSYPLALAGGLAAVAFGGAVFGALYQRTGTLVAPITAHWVVDALMLCALYDWRSRGARGSSER